MGGKIRPTAEAKTKGEEKEKQVKREVRMQELQQRAEFPEEIFKEDC